MTGNRVKVLGVATAWLLMGIAPVSAQQDVQPSKTIATYGNWSIACNLVSVANADGSAQQQELCELTSQVNIRGEDQVIRPLLQVAVGRMPGQENLRILFQVPGNAYLRMPVSLILDPSEDQPADQVPEDAISATYIRCDSGRCIADANLTGEDQARIEAAQSARVSYVNVTGSRVGVPLSMDGYKASAADMASR